LEVDAGEALEVVLEESLGVVLPDLLARHGREEGSMDTAARSVFGLARLTI
jgi:hypothetical protein